MKKTLAMLIFLLSNISQAADVVVIRPDDEDFHRLNEMVANSLRNEYSVETAIIGKSTSYEEFQEKISKAGTKVVVAMDNHAIRHLKRYFELHPQSNLRGIAAMGVNLKDLIPKNKFIAGVAYEVAGYLAVKGFKSATGSSTKTVLGVYRSSVAKIFAEEAKAQLSRERVNLQLLDIEGIADDSISQAVSSDIKKLKPDAIWLINDNKIINPKTLSSLWLLVAREQKIPILCGIQKLAKELGICVYSETPTLQGTAEKISGIIFGYIADENDADFYGVEYIQETEKTTNRYLLDTLGFGSLKQTEGVEVYTGKILGR